MVQIFSDIPQQPDYLSFVDDDIREMFEGKGSYFISDILYAQLIKELRKLNDRPNAELRGRALADGPA